VKGTYLSRPFFTVVIPTYNRSQLLRGAIQSVIDQTFRDFELLVVDDHSSDETKQVIESFKDDRVNYILNDRKSGGAGTRNCGIFRAQGQWVAFLDDDDIWLPEKLEIQYKKINEVDNSTGLIYSGFSFRSSRKRWNGHVFMPKRQGRMLDDLLYDNYIGALCTVIIRTDILNNIGGFDERFSAHQDLDLYVRVAAVSNITFVSQCLVSVTLSSNNRISLDYEKKLEACSLFWNKHFNLIKCSRRLLHRNASRIFVFAIVLADIPKIRKYLPWVFWGPVVDPKNFVWMIRTVFSLLYKEKFRKKSKNSTKSRNRN
jgi:glycosyltransferase involved in cell wall biosynthesis